MERNAVFVVENNKLYPGKPKKLITKDPSSNAIYSGLIIIFNICRVLAVLPITRNSKGRIILKFKTPITLYCIIMFLIMMILEFYLIKLEIEHNNRTNLSFLDKTTQYAGISIRLAHFIPICILLERKQIALYFDQWKKFEKNYEKVTRSLLKVEILKFQLSTVFISAILFFTFIYYAIQNYMAMALQYKWHLNYWLLIGTAYTFNVMLACALLWITLNKSIMFVCELFMTQIKKEILYPDVIRDYRNLWMDLRNLPSNLGCHFGVTFTYYMLNIIIFNLWGIYTLTAHIINGSSSILIVLILCISGNLFMALIAEIAYWTTQKVNNDIVDFLIEQMKIKHDKETDKELKLFYAYAVSHPAKITLAGYSTLDRSFNLSVYSNYIMYLIIFLQMTPIANCK